MRDQVFEGRDLAEAVAAAARALGLPGAALRYVVLDPGAGGVLGMGGTPARIAVLLDRPPAAPAAAPVPRDPRAGIETVLRALAEAARVEIGATVEESDEAVVVRLQGPGCGFFLERGGRVLQALEHLLQRMFSRALAPRRLGLDCEGYREQREAALRALVRGLVAEVRSDGQPHSTGPLNSYERRIVHMAVQEEPGLRSFSVGEGSERRVTVAPAAQGPEDEGRG